MECLTTSLLTVFTQTNFTAHFLRAKSILIRKGKIVAFEAPFGGLGATWVDRLRLIGKLLLSSY